MSSPGHHSYSVPPPRSESPVPTSSAGGHGSYGSSGTPPMEGSSSRRTSQSSIRLSPSSQHRQANYGPRGQSHSDARKGTNGSGHGDAHVPIRLPRITTVNVDAHTGGPQSAPLRPHQSRSLMPNGLDTAGSGPMRSSSSPDPWLDRSPSRDSPSSSPIDNRPNPVLGPPQSSSRGPSPAGSSRSQLPPSAIPPRRSSHIDKAGGMSTVSSQQSLSDNDMSIPTDVTPLSFPVPQTRSSKRGEPTYCGQCGQVVHGQFVRAMGHVYHLNCFRCKDCNKVVAQKFFPVEEGDNMYPLCETDYFARLDLICAKCGQALRSSYITACGEKYHVEHFTCSECDTLFGPNDSYYEHSGRVYCHFHYSTKFAVKCVGCETAILKQFVEMNRNGRDECWHPECYMISKFWNVRLASKNFNTPSNSAINSTVSLLEITPAHPTPDQLAMSPASDLSITPAELKDRQEKMEVKVQQIWHVLSGYEESSAALIGEMLRAVNGQQLLEIILLAEKFILHVEVLFAVVDDLEAQFALSGAKGMSHAREAKQLCRKLVNLFSMMSQIAPGTESPINTTELFTLITQLAHYLKILIRITLTGSIKLERDYGNTTAMSNALARLNLLAMDNSDPAVTKRGVHGAEPTLKPIQANIEHVSGGTGDEEQLRRNIDALTRSPKGYIASTQNLAYGYRSLAPEVTGETTLRGPQDESYVPPEGCAHCQLAMEEDCIRYGMFNRWHSGCVICIVCGDRALVPYEEEEPLKAPSDEGSIVTTKTVRRQPPRVGEFCFEPPQPAGKPPSTVYCVPHRTGSAIKGFDSVSRLEQYAFLLHIALRRLYIHYRTHHQLPSVRGRHIEDPPEVKRMKSVTLDRKLSSTARLPQRSMVVESPAGRIANEDGQMSARSNTFLSPRAVPSPSPDVRLDGDDSSVNVLRPAFARNNTSVMIIKEGQATIDEDASEMLAASTITPEDDAITLGDIPHLADQAIRINSGVQDGRIPMSTLNPLQSLIIRHFALLQLLKSGIGPQIDLDDVLELLEARKNQWWNKIFKNNAKKDTKKKGIFGVPLEILVERTGSDSQQGASNAQMRVPEIIEDIISTMRQMDMAVEGIFRKNGNIRRLQQISEALDKDTTNVNLSEENPVQLAALLKRFLREMPDPLLTFRLHKLFCAAASLKNLEERRRCLHLLMVLLPRVNRDTVEVLFVFLKWVASFSYRDEETGSRMDMANLATVICPSILYAKGVNAAKDESFIGIQAVQELLQEQDEFYHVPNELSFVISENIFNIFAKDLDLPPKEIHRHCSKYMQARGHQRITPSSSANQVRDRPSETRLGVHRSEGNLNGEMNGSPFRVPAPPGSNGSSRPTSWIQGQNTHFGSQQSLNAASMQSPSATPWRGGGGNGGGGPFQGAANGSRQSSRGSAPSSPGPDHEREPRRSFNMDRERSRTPVQVDHR